MNNKKYILYKSRNNTFIFKHKNNNVNDVVNFSIKQETEISENYITEYLKENIYTIVNETEIEDSIRLYIFNEIYTGSKFNFNTILIQNLTLKQMEVNYFISCQLLNVNDLIFLNTKTYSNFDTEFLLKFRDKLDWKKVFITKYFNNNLEKVNFEEYEVDEIRRNDLWSFISSLNLTEEFIKEHFSNLNLEVLFSTNNFSTEFLLSIIDLVDDNCHSYWAFISHKIEDNEIISKYKNKLNWEILKSRFVDRKAFFPEEDIQKNKHIDDFDKKLIIENLNDKAYLSLIQDMNLVPIDNIIDNKEKVICEKEKISIKNFITKTLLKIRDFIWLTKFY